MSDQSIVPVPAAFDYDAEAVKTLICPRCESKPTDPCRTLSGRKAETHTARFEPLVRAFEAGVTSTRSMGSVPVDAVR